MPSKKNSWHRGANGGIYVPEGVKSKLDDFLWQLKPVVMKQGKQLPITDICAIDAIFHTCDRLDLDNKLTTLLDLLQKSGCIKNDKQIEEIHAKKIRCLKEPYLEVTLSTLTT